MLLLLQIPQVALHVAESPNRAVLPSLQRQSEKNYRSLRAILGLRFNYGQFLQLENVAASMLDVKEFVGQYGPPGPSIPNALRGVRAEEISKSRFPVFPKFLGLVLGCIEAKFCK